jgi:dCMP deaminase
MMCKRLVLNAGIKEVIVRENEKDFTVYTVSDWIENDDSLTGKFGY